MSEVKAIPNVPDDRGRGHTQGTVLARVMEERHVRVHAVSFMLGVGDRAMYNYLTRRRKVPMVNFATVCDYFDMDIEELVDGAGLLTADPNYTPSTDSSDFDGFDDGWGT